MANKKYSVTQKLNLGGQKTSRTFNIECEGSELLQLCSYLEGAVSVKVVDPAFTMGNADTLVDISTANFCRNIKVGYVSTAGHRTNEFISTFDKKSIVFKPTADRKEVETVLLNKGLAGEEATKPQLVDADFSGTYKN